ncbi:MAG TPA: DUF6600 domain-containing protein [Geminicoccus sp.]|jgi:hypothetical protein|uniref:DUF6600 domain-containing protein n=1 Tax=Geminicoccus sp. TaxID=2024832 RepID=UPI002E30C68B|nr:DUF6600 domain-containing protein [Geminicoccus sp.]HEX2525717.1 DUF6600 domain-containing protein [Geminicoccus sp.]
MRRRALLLGLLVAPAVAADELLETIADQFRPSLEPLGRWRDLPGLGPAWQPDRVPDSWRPFSRGRWRLTFEAGWVWQGSLPFSAITEHRGRWRRLDDGWWWIPGTRFDPAPVAWARPARDEVAWAPLPGGDRPIEGWLSLPLARLADTEAPIAKPREGAPLRRVAPPDPAEVEAAAGRALDVVSLADLVDREDVRAWYFTDSRSVFGIGSPALQRPPPAPTPGTTGPSSPDDAFRSFERERQLNLRENERLWERERRRDANELR